MIRSVLAGLLIAILAAPSWGQALPPDLALVHPDALAFSHVRLADIWQHESLKETRALIQKAGPKALATFDEQFVPKPSSAERVTAVVLPMRGDDPTPRVVVIVRFATPFDTAAVRTSYAPNGVSKKAGAKEYLVDEQAGFALYYPDLQTLLASDPATMAEYLTTAPNPDGPLKAAIALAATKPLTVAVNVSRLPIPDPILDMAPPELRPLTKAKTVVATMDLGKDIVLTAKLQFGTEADAIDGEKGAREGLKFARQMLIEPRKQAEEMLYGKKPAAGVRPAGELPLALAGIGGLAAINTLDELLTEPPLVREKTTLTVSVTLPPWATQYLGTAALGTGIALPALQRVRADASRLQSQNNLKQIALAMHNYESAYGHLPSAAIVDKKGKRLLSWRVMILPYLEQDALYRQFKLDEPWDSEHNIKLSQVLVKVYVDPRMPDAREKTYYKVFVGKDAAFDWVAGRQLARIPDGTSNTIMCVAAGDPVIWTKPDDFEFDAKKPLPDLSKPFGNLMFAMCDGSVRTLTFPPGKDRTSLLKLLIQTNDGMVIPNDF